jgi:hypothetical protein
MPTRFDLPRTPATSTHQNNKNDGRKKRFRVEKPETPPAHNSSSSSSCIPLNNYAKAATRLVVYVSSTAYNTSLLVKSSTKDLLRGKKKRNKKLVFANQVHGVAALSMQLIR